ncbi:VOC family protein [Alkalihalobacillus sp. TS-13]|uniref:VOC family protein n=1 Tax=Alkalihalobacillus sp. TS-13 TaxID=2842455 RepID=UPI001C88519C|nr:VOC family protein [Alkalihalobacillus sp. TS-13]
MKIEFKRLHHVQICIPTGEEEEARKFYSEVLGMTEIEKPKALKKNGGLWFQVADIELHIGTEPYTEKSKRHPAFEITDLDRVRDHLQAHDVTVKEETQIPGMKRFSFFDPFHNRIEFLETHKENWAKPSHSEG